MNRHSDDLLRLVANTIRGLAMDGVQKARSGHPGMPMGMADVATVLWLEQLRYWPKDPSWRGRDRFVLSAGHGSMLLYSLLHLAGYDLGIEDLQSFRQLDSRTPGHPELGHTAGVETTTGPLGQGFGNGIGLALGARMEAARFGQDLFETRVFAIVSDGDLMEGISSEAASFAGHLALSNLVYLYDDNHITIEGGTELAFSEDVEKRFAGFGWRVLRADGHDLSQIRAALDEATAENTRPTLIRCHTHIAFGSPHKVDTAGAHGAPLGEEEIALTKQALGLPQTAFFVPDEVRATFEQRAKENGTARETWLEQRSAWQKAEPERAAEHAAFLERRVPGDLLEQLIEAAGEEPAATRALSGRILQRAAELVPSLVGGSADLDPSTKTQIKSASYVRADDLAGRNLHFGIREHAMGAILNGLALHGGFLPMGSTFLVFSDYMRPAVRLAALMGLPVGFIYTHDSLMLGEDGPTHQPVEHLAALRLIPDLHLFRPADGAETAAAWTHVLTRRDGPVALALTRQSLPCLPRPNDFVASDILRGGYVIAEPTGSFSAVLVATGAEVALAIEAASLLAAKGLALRVVSMPCLELFLAQDEATRHSVLPPAVAVFAIEMGRPEIWCQLTGSPERVIGQSSFGASAPAKDLAARFGFTPEQVAQKLESMLARLSESPA